MTKSWLDLPPRFVIGYPENRVRQPVAERFIVLELLEKLGIIGEKRRDDTFKRLVVFNASVLPVRILLGVLVSLVGGNFLWNFVRNALIHSLGVGKESAELVVESFYDI